MTRLKVHLPLLCAGTLNTQIFSNGYLTHLKPSVYQICNTRQISPTVRLDAHRAPFQPGQYRVDNLLTRLLLLTWNENVTKSNRWQG